MARDIRESLDQSWVGRLQIGILSGPEAGTNQAGLPRVQALLTAQATKKDAGERQISPTPNEDHMILILPMAASADQRNLLAGTILDDSQGSDRPIEVHPPHSDAGTALKHRLTFGSTAAFEDCQLTAAS
jgi:hypothetical protein